MSTELFSRLLIKKELGRGSMAVVYLAEDTTHQRYVALKILRPEYNNNAYIRDLFLQEASLLIEFRHTNAVAVLGYGKLPDNRLYMVQELARGESLDSILTLRKTLCLAEACEIVEQVLSCLQSAHEQEIIHRDVTPDNILIEQREHSAKPGVKVIDFGIARSRKNGPEEEVTQVCIGTPAYMAPEIVMDETLFDHRVDIYSVGVLLFELLYGELPVYHEDHSALFSYKVSKAWQHNPLWEKVPPLLKSFFNKALAPVAKERFYNAASMLGELYEIRQALSKETGYIKPLSLPEW